MFGWFKKKQALRVVPAPITDMAERHGRLQDDQERLAAPTTFDPADAALTAAWTKRNTDAIQQQLQIGDGRTREAWAVAIAAFNAAKEDIELTRGRLRYLVTEAERALVAYKIDYSTITLRPSGTLYGEMKQASLPPKDFFQRLDYAQGTSMAVTKAVTGGGSWQAAAAAVVFSGIMMAVNHQKLLRQLRELQGRLTEQAEAVRKDARFVADELRLRMVPQFEWLAGLIERLESELRLLKDAEAAAMDTEARQAKAFQLACAFREAKHVLEMKAGD